MSSYPTISSSRFRQNSSSSIWWLAAVTVTSSVLAGIVGVWIGQKQKQRYGNDDDDEAHVLPKNPHSPNSQAYEIQNHIQTTQTPARLLGIVVNKCTPTSLSLSAPLLKNENVHGTAFAGSLYSVAVLCSYYLGRMWIQQRTASDDTPNYILVAKSGSIAYKRPVQSSEIVATSVLPSNEVLDTFFQTLSEKGKASMFIDGSIPTNPKEYITTSRTACEYSIEVCAYISK